MCAERTHAVLKVWAKRPSETTNTFQTAFLLTNRHSNQTKAAHRHTHVGSTVGKTIIRSGGDTSLKGAQLIGKGIQADTRNLHIESVQDTETYQGKQQNGNVQVTVGYGFSANGSYSQSKVKADHASVTEQSGIYAGEDGYQIKVGDNTDLKGGLLKVMDALLMLSNIGLSTR